MEQEYQTKMVEIAQTQEFSKRIVIIGILVGLMMNWLTLYLNVVLGLMSVGISAFVVLLFTKILLREKATSQNLSLVSIAYGATSSAEASIGLLFLIWLYNNASSFGFENFNPPGWLLPSSTVISNRIVLTNEWIVPLLVHYFLMLIPGISGLILGIYLAPKFINNEEEYPFPGIIQRVKTVEVLVTNQTSKINLFKRFGFLGFFVALITLFYPVIDFSNTNTGLVFGIMLGTIGVTMFSVGFVINNPKISVPAGISSLVLYTVVTPLIINIADFKDQIIQGNFTNDFFGLYSYLLQHKYLSFLIGFIISASIISPFVFSQIKKIIIKLRKKNQTFGVTPSSDISSENKAEFEENEQTKGVNEGSNPAQITKNSSYFQNITSSIGKRELIIFISYITVLIISTLFIVTLNILPSTDFILVLLLLMWIMILGSFIQGYITVSTIAKASAAATIPFIFDNIPLFLVGARGLTPYIATPKAEVGETIGMVSTLKFGQQMKISQKNTVLAFLAGYIVAVLATPFFTLFLWKALGIGNVNFPAPAFPIFLALIGPFAAGALDVFLKISEMIFGGILALFFPTIGLSVAIGMFFPPHMAICLSLGGITAFIAEKRKGKEWMKDKGQIIATAISVGATLTVPILILLNLLT
ncbi:MAG: OPT/YSL family transporter [Candidatus Heimdallarchaeota archaeon]|nr:MAG: OPT/YSL family transporter [Candidatus Heimdallarchaeota archaeon]